MPVITISRQPGSYGPRVAQRLADDLGLHLADKEYLHTMAQKYDTEYHAAWHTLELEEFTGFLDRLLVDQTAYRCLFEALHYELASRGDMVILGRGAHIALDGPFGAVRLHMVADHEVRVRRIMEQRGIGEREAEKFIEHFTSSRKAVVRTIFGRKYESPNWYDLIINTTHLSVDQTVELIEQYVKTREKGTEDLVTKEELGLMARAKFVELHIRRKISFPPYLDFHVRMLQDNTLVLEGFVEHQLDVAQAQECVAEVDPELRVDNKLQAIGTTQLYHTINRK